MGNELFANDAIATLAIAVQSTDTTISLTTGDGAMFPYPSSPTFLWATLVNGDNVEICECIGNATDVLTVVRAQQGTVAQNFPTTGTTVELRPTKFTYEGFAQLSGATFSGPVIAPQISLTDQVTPLNSPVIESTTYSANNNDMVMADTSSSAWTLTLPGSPVLGYQVLIVDMSGTFAVNNLTVAGNGAKIVGNAANLVLDVNNASIWLMYCNSTRGWILVQV